MREFWKHDQHKQVSITCTWGGAVSCFWSRFRNTSSSGHQHSRIEGAHSSGGHRTSELYHPAERLKRYATLSFWGMFGSWDLVHPPFLCSPLPVLPFPPGCTRLHWISLPCRLVQCISTQSSAKKYRSAKTHAKPWWWERPSVLFPSQAHSAAVHPVIAFHHVVVWV